MTTIFAHAQKVANQRRRPEGHPFLAKSEAELLAFVGADGLGRPAYLATMIRAGLFDLLEDLLPPRLPAATLSGQDWDKLIAGEQIELIGKLVTCGVTLFAGFTPLFKAALDDPRYRPALAAGLEGIDLRHHMQQIEPLLSKDPVLSADTLTCAVTLNPISAQMVLWHALREGQEARAIMMLLAGALPSPLRLAELPQKSRDLCRRYTGSRHAQMTLHRDHGPLARYLSAFPS